MSGGHWDYRGCQIREILQEMAMDHHVATRFPALAKRLDALGEALFRIEHELDWDLSGDTEIRDDRSFEHRALSSLNRPDNID